MFILRQDEWDEYRTALPVTQGDLADPAYFDFMSFCQYATIADGMRNGQLLFNELIDANGTSVVVTRDPSLPRDNARLPEVHSSRVGERILEWMDDRFPTIAPRVPATLNAAGVFDGLKQLAAIFEINDFMLTDTIEPLPGGGGFRWTLVAPATMWSSQVLRARGDLANDFEAKAVVAYLRRCNVPVTYSSKYESTQVSHEFVWPASLLR